MEKLFFQEILKSAEKKVNAKSSHAIAITITTTATKTTTTTTTATKTTLTTIITPTTFLLSC